MSKKITELKKLALKADENEINALIYIAEKSGLNKKDINDIKKSYSFKSKTISTDNKSYQLSITNNLYSDIINKIKHIAGNDDLIKQIGGLKILVYGRTGTGKTSLIKEIIRELLIEKDNELSEINFERLISYKMGQSQINILNLIHDIKHASKSKRQIIFIDELDSIVSNRLTNNDMGEHHRVVATFIKFLDSLPDNSVLFSATNVPEKIDEAIIRRYTLKVKGKEINYLEFIKIVKEEINISLNKFTKFIDPKTIKYMFTISDLNEYINGLMLNKAIPGSEIDPFTFFVSHFREKFPIKLIRVSDRTTSKLKKVLINE